MFDTRSGFWLMASIVHHRACSPPAPSSCSPPTSELTYDNFAAAIGFPMAVILPMIAILVGHQRVEPAQRADHVHPGAAPRPGDRRQGDRRRRRRRRRRCSSRSAIGALGNLVGSAIAGVDPVWDITRRPTLALDRARQRARAADRLHARRADPQLRRRDRGATSSTRCVLPDAGHAARREPGVVRATCSRGSTSTTRRARCSTGDLTGERVGPPRRSTGLIWLVVPLAVGLVLVLRSEVK